jgi:fumarate reductase subunit D
VLVDGIVQRGGTEKPLLERARSLKLRRAALGVVAGIALALGVVSATFASVAALFIGAKSLVLGGAALVPLLVSLASWVAARRSTTAIHDAMAEAEVTVAKELISAGAARDASALTRLMRLSPGRSEELFGRAEVERLLDEPTDLPPLDRVRVRVEGEKSVEDELASETSAELRNRAR